MNETDKHGVWTYNTNAEWAEQNGGLPDMLLVWGLTVQHARQVAAQMAERYPDDTFEVRDYKSDVVDTYGTPRPDLVEASRERRAARKTRRPLADRG
jgi:hypothetical protein